MMTVTETIIMTIDDDGDHDYVTVLDKSIYERI